MERRRILKFSLIRAWRCRALSSYYWDAPGGSAPAAWASPKEDSPIFGPGKKVDLRSPKTAGGAYAAGAEPPRASHQYTQSKVTHQGTSVRKYRPGAAGTEPPGAYQ